MFNFDFVDNPKFSQFCLSLSDFVDNPKFSQFCLSLSAGATLA